MTDLRPTLMLTYLTDDALKAAFPQALANNGVYIPGRFNLAAGDTVLVDLRSPRGESLALLDARVLTVLAVGAHAGAALGFEAPLAQKQKLARELALRLGTPTPEGYSDVALVAPCDAATWLGHASLKSTSVSASVHDSRTRHTASAPPASISPAAAPPAAPSPAAPASTPGAKTGLLPPTAIGTPFAGLKAPTTSPTPQHGFTAPPMDDSQLLAGMGIEEAKAAIEAASDSARRNDAAKRFTAKPPAMGPEFDAALAGPQTSGLSRRARLLLATYLALAVLTIAGGVLFWHATNAAPLAESSVTPPPNPEPGTPPTTDRNVLTNAGPIRSVERKVTAGNNLMITERIPVEDERYPAAANATDRAQAATWDARGKELWEGGNRDLARAFLRRAYRSNRDSPNASRLLSDADKKEAIEGPETTARLIVKSSAQGVVHLAGRDYYGDEIEFPALQPGAAQIEFRPKEGQPVTKSLILRAGETATLQFP